MKKETKKNDKKEKKLNKTKDLDYEKKQGCIRDKEVYILKTYKGKSTTVRDLQLEILEIMDEIHRICVKNDIEYGLMAGSALGIVNYQGFIPWDDDIDVIVPRKDWNRFIEAMKKDLGDKFYFHCYETDKKYNVIMGPTMKVRKKGTWMEEVNFLLKNRCKGGDGIFVDVIIYDNIAESKLVDQIHRTFMKLLMPIYVLLDNLRIPHDLLSRFIRWYANKYSRRHENSSLVSQPISVPWEKFLKEPIFKKEDVYPFKLYNFEGRKYYSYNNIEKILKQWYGPNCLKKWDGTKWIETLPVEKRKPKHTANLNLYGEEPQRED